MAVLTSKRRGFGRPRSPKERRDSRMKNYIGRECLLKSVDGRLVLVFERLTLCKKHDLKTGLSKYLRCPETYLNRRPQTLTSSHCGKRDIHRKPSRKLPIRLLKSGS